MKRLISVLLIVAALLGMASCSKDKEYPPVESTEEEARTVMTLNVDGNTYDVRYELYRALFLTYKGEFDGGNADVWVGEEKNTYVERINEKIINRITEIYAAFALCDRIGYDIYSSDVDKKIKENIRISVEGGSYGSSVIEGYESYEDYLAALKSMYLNYSVQTLLLRYAIAVDAIDTYYIGTASSDDVDINLTEGNLKYTDEDVRSFYFSDGCVRVMRASFQKGISYEPLKRAEKLSDTLRAAAESAQTKEDKEAAVFNAIMGSSLYSNVDEIRNGYVIGRYNLDTSYYGDMTDAAFDLSEGEVSAPIDVVTDVENSYYVLYRTYKSEEHLSSEFDEIKYIYLMNCVGEISHGVAVELKNSITYTDFFNSIDHSKIGM